MVNSDSQRAQLRHSFSAAAKEIGDKKALKKAMNAAGDNARMHAQVRKIPWRTVEQAAEEAIKNMLG